MYTGTCEFDLLFGAVGSRKEKRSLVRPLVAELRRRFDVAAAETGHQDLLRRALVGVVNEGTGKSARLPNIQVAGKTGTAQVVALDSDKSKREKDRHRKDHAWFVAYAPASDPRVAVAVLVEHGGHGGSAAGPLAKRVIAAAMSEPRMARGNRNSTD